MNQSNITGKLNTLATTEKKINEYKTDYIDIDDLVPNENNKFGMRDIEQLASDIEVHGLNYPIIARKTEDGVFEIIGGHRRYEAIKYLKEHKKWPSRKVAVNIVNCKDPLEITERLILDNALTRELNDWERLNMIVDLKNIYLEKKNKGEISGEISDIIAKKVCLSHSLIKRFLSVESKLIPEFKSAIEKNELGLTLAYEIAQLEDKYQEKLLSLNFLSYINLVSVRAFQSFKKALLDNPTDEEAIITEFIKEINPNIEIPVDSTDNSDSKTISTKASNQWNNVLSRDSYNVQTKIKKLLKKVKSVKKDNVEFNKEMISDLTSTLKYVKELEETITNILDTSLS